MKEKIWKGRTKYLIIAIIVIILVFSISAGLITLLNNTFTDLAVSDINALVTDKYINKNDTEHYYVIVDDNGEVFDIVNVSNSQILYDRIEIGHKYHFVIQGGPNETDKYMHIVQVYDGTN